MSTPAVVEAPAAAPDPALAELRVALLSPCTWPEVRRGAERMFRDLAAGLIRRGHQPWLITSHPDRPQATVENGLEVTRNWRPPDGRLRRRGYEEHLTHVPGTYMSLRRGRADLAHASHAPDAVAAGRWSRERGRPAIFSFMGIPDRQWLVAKRLRLEFVVRAVRDCQAVVALSRHAQEAFHTTLGVRARVIYPGVDTRAFTPGGERSEAASILCVAPPEVPEKRVGLLVAALGRVRRERPGTVLVLQRPRDPAVGERLAREPGVQLMDSDPALLAGAYRRAWVTALPSSSDAFGLVLAESLACGTPVVGSDRGGIPEVIDRPEIGCMFAREDPADVARALVDGLDVAGEPSSARACRARAEELSLERCVESYERLYRELLGEGERVASGVPAAGPTGAGASAEAPGA
ncbi:MAG TPA: glycosyltransferase family 4 protein [Solirubrobacteraceae bacterium]|jgi:glycosyltransferase involved in cell wall biosynthesis|nr:glycosyltransferase family 4 protein [Solirubrobacteraceae bacterium]